jgi:hypothetical protein
VREGLGQQGRGVGGSNYRTAAWLAWSLWVLTIGLMALALLFTALYPLPRDPATSIVNFAVAILFVATFLTVGALIASRRPHNPIGWIFCAMSLALVVAMASGNYAEYSLVVEPGSLPWAKTAAWVGNWIWPISLIPVGFFLLLFPDGRPPSGRWKVVVWLQGVALMGWFISQAFVPGPLVNSGYESIRNPYGIEALGDILKALGPISGILLVGTMLASAFSIVVRFRRSRGEVRRQIKWVAYAGALVIVVVILQLVIETLLAEGDRLTDILNLTFVVSLTSVPIAAGIAMLRYRLYDIDLLINHTLVYAVLTAMLALVYFGGVTATQAIFRTLTGQQQQPQLAIVVSTLVIAALFNPLRRRIQAFIDRRFYRKKYDARKTLEAFSAKLRNETDLEALNSELVGVVKETMQPAHVSLWLRPDTASKTGEQKD